MSLYYIVRRSSELQKVCRSKYLRSQSNPVPQIFDVEAGCSEVWRRADRSEGGGRSRDVTAERSEAGARRGAVCLSEWIDPGFRVPRSKSGAFHSPILHTRMKDFV